MKYIIAVLLMLFPVLSEAQGIDSVPAVKLQTRWDAIEYKGAPWVMNTSRPRVKNGLEGRHLSLWASHGRYYDLEKGRWKWQRPVLFSTCEDLFTQTIVVPYLIPMLENAGAYVFTPRERDWQKNEVIVDNDSEGMQLFPRRAKTEIVRGFAMHPGFYQDGENPFEAGTALVIPTGETQVKYTPHIDEAGQYAVYVSYPKVDDAVDDVEYTVYHSGIATRFRVNQQMGYGTWVYLGTFHFSKSKDSQPDLNCVVVSAQSAHKGHIGTDAVRLGGGMGNIRRGDFVSTYARCLEGARYSAQWAGAPYAVYSSKNGTNDYADDINVRSHMTNWLNGGSVFNPDTTGLGVPLELTLAVHSDAGYDKDMKSVYGTLSIATTDFNNGRLATPVSRSTSYDFAQMLFDNLEKDMRLRFGEWTKRKILDKNYSETRLPSVPSAIIEMLSHQSFPDMKYGQHPYGKFEIARSLYKSVLKFESYMHDQPYTVQPLPPADFCMELNDEQTVILSWEERIDMTEASATPTSYRLYTAVEDYDFDNGQTVSGNRVAMKLQPGLRYRFKVTAVNNGGESFPTNTLAAYISRAPKAKVMVVDGFDRLSAPTIIDNDSIQAFNLGQDEGVPLGRYPGWTGKDNDMAGVFFAGNTFDVAVEHVNAIAAIGSYTVVSSSLKAFEKGVFDSRQYDVLDMAFGLQKDDGQLGLHFRTLTEDSQSKLSNYTLQGGRLLLSGAYLASDVTSTETGTQFLDERLHCCYAPADSLEFGGVVKGMGTEFEVYNRPNALHYAATHPQLISPIGEGFAVMRYDNGGCAAVACKTEGGASLVMGFPFECITDRNKRNSIMSGILTFLLL